jgi:hypothetical protein
MRERMLMAWERLTSLWDRPLGELTLADLALLIGSFYLMYWASRFLGFALTDREVAPWSIAVAVTILCGWIGYAMAGSGGAVYGILAGIILGGGIVLLVERRRRLRDDAR